MVCFSKAVHLLSEQLVVHLNLLHLFVAVLQALVALTQLSDVVAGFGQDASFTLRSTARSHVEQQVHRTFPAMVSLRSEYPV